jgi:hypothetical protein
MRKELKFIELVKTNDIYKLYEDTEGIIKVKVEYFAVYLDTTDNCLEFFPVCNIDFTEGYLIEEPDSNCLGLVDLSNNWNLLSKEDFNNEMVKTLTKKHK